MIGLRQRNVVPPVEPLRRNGAPHGTDGPGSVTIPSVAKNYWTVRKIEMVFQVAAVCLYLSGFLARRKFHTAGDCEMTWSWPQFVPIHVPTSSKYRLFKFVDARDQRYQRFLTATDPLHGSDWCGRKNETHIVLYVPGHWGSYKQARSLGAHGLQLTRAESNDVSQRAEYSLAHYLWTGVSSDPSTFVYDVYSLDFLNQGGALHGQFLSAQSEFISEVIMFLVKSCEANTITIVAHSIGGYAARLTPLVFPRTKQYVKNIITLATPHDGLPFALDPSVDKVISKINQKDAMEGITLISICGGMRDEMIPPSTCFLNSANSMTILAADVMKGPLSQSMSKLGMDHRAIVWCHNLLSVVRDIIFTLHLSDRADETVQGKLNRVIADLGLKTDHSFQDTLQSHMTSFRAAFGFWQAAVMETTMLYRCELFLILFALAGTMHCALGGAHIPFIVPLGLSLLASFWSKTGLRFISIFILSSTADGLYQGILVCLSALQSRFFTLPPVTWLRLCVASFAVNFLLLEISWTSYSRYAEGYFSFLQWQAALFLATIIHVHLLILLPTKPLSCQRDAARRIRTLSLFLPTLPSLVVGKVMITSWTEKCDASSWRFVLTVIAPIYLWLLTTYAFHQSKRPNHSVLTWVKPCVVAVVCLTFGPHLLCIGCGFRVAYLISLSVWLEITETIIRYIL